MGLHMTTENLRQESDLPRGEHTVLSHALTALHAGPSQAGSHWTCSTVLPGRSFQEPVSQQRKTEGLSSMSKAAHL